VQKITTVQQRTPSLRGDIAGDLLHPGLIRVNRDSSNVHPAAVKMDEKQHVVGHQTAQRDCRYCIKAFSETDFTEDLKKIDVPTLVMHGDDDQIVPFTDAGPLSAKLLKKATTRFYRETGSDEAAWSYSEIRLGRFWNRNFKTNEILGVVLRTDDFHEW
jgi:pimeloyl-ACP methyl ester carboxylesterase